MRPRRGALAPRSPRALGRWVRSATRRARRRPRCGSVRRTRRPRNTPSMRRLWASVSATNRVIPRSRAAAARCSSRAVPIPRPWCSSLTTNATSAESVPGCAVVASDADEPVAELGHQRDAGVVVHMGEPLDLVGAQRRLGGEEPQVHGLVREACVERHETVGVLGAERPHMDGATVGQDHVALPVRRRGARVREVVPVGRGRGVGQPRGRGRKPVRSSSCPSVRVCRCRGGRSSCPRTAPGARSRRRRPRRRPSRTAGRGSCRTPGRAARRPGRGTGSWRARPRCRVVRGS